MSDTRNIIDKIQSGDYSDAVADIHTAMYARSEDAIEAHLNPEVDDETEYTEYEFGSEEPDEDV